MEYVCICAKLLQVIEAANAEAARGMKNPLYKLWQKLPGTSNTGQAAISKFHGMMNDLLQEVIVLHILHLTDLVCAH